MEHAPRVEESHGSGSTDGSDSLLYVYGIVPSGDAERLALDGVGTPPTSIDAVHHYDLAALVSPVRDQRATRREDVLAHARALEAAIEQTTVLPMRFGMTLPGPEAVVEDLLASDYERWDALLEEFDGTVELLVRGFEDEEEMLRRVVEDQPQVRSLRGSSLLADRVRLGELVVEALQRLRSEEADRLIDRLGPLARAHREEPPAIDGMVANAAFLVERDQLDRFDRAFEQIAQERGDVLRLRCLGPQPPYTFVPAREGA